MASKLQLRNSFSASQTPAESDYHALIDSLAHLTEDAVTDLDVQPAAGKVLSAMGGYGLSQKIADLTTLANNNKTAFEAYDGDHYDKATVNANINAAILAANTYTTGQVNIALDRITQAETDLTIANIAIPAARDAAIAYCNNSFASRDASIAEKLSIDLFNSHKTALQNSINGKASSSHTHSEYLESSDLANYATLNDLAIRSIVGHTHPASEITGLENIYTTPVAVQALIDANKVDLDETAILDDFYDKAEVDAKAEITLGSAKAYADTVKSELLGDAPIELLDTLAELGKALTNEENPPAVDFLTITNSHSAELSTIGSSISAIQASVTALEGQVGTGVIASIQSELTQLENKVNVTIDEKIAGLQEQINASMALITILAGTSSSGSIDYTALEAVTGIESATLSITGISQSLSGLTTEPLNGGFTADSRNDTVLAGDGDYLPVVFKGTDNPNQLIAYNETLAQWEWMWVDPSTSALALIASQLDTDDAHVPDFWSTVAWSGLPSTLSGTFTQDSTSAVVDYLEALRFFTSGYVQQGLNYGSGE